MYKITLSIVLLLAASVSFAQDFSFKPAPTAPTSSQPSSNMLPQRQPTPSPEGFANSSTRAFQAQQSKIDALAVEQRRITAMERAKLPQTPAAPQTTSPLSKPMQQQPQGIPSIRPATTPVVTTQPAPPPEPAPASQPYTGFQSPAPKSTPEPTDNNAGSSGWGSSIKY